MVENSAGSGAFFPSEKRQTHTQDDTTAKVICNFLLHVLSLHAPLLSLGDVIKRTGSSSTDAPRLGVSDIDAYLVPKR